ncbi:MAG: hypothetical protein ACFFA6_17510, partial [Promethearchaeota archaeon]
KQWVVFYRRENDKSNCIYGIVYRAHAYRQDRPQALLPWQLADGSGNDVCLGKQNCEVQVRDILKNYGGPVELAIWGYTEKLRTRLSLFYFPGIAAQSDVGDLRYVHYRSFDGDRGIRFEGETTLIVKKTITVGQDRLARNQLCQYEVYEQTNGQYSIAPTRSTVRFRDEEVPSEYPPQPEEVVVAFCRTYHDEGARKRYLDNEAGEVTTGCIGPTAKVEVLKFLDPPSEVGNSATVRVQILIDGQGQRDTTWSLRYAERPTGQDSAKRWQWRITGCSSP